ncbi:outer membrane beta-barrel family protein [Leptobacterium sp. I13]|uniref:outer membrane beta-barrel family protein n=1 Tax=Leptobacterium meishanense TaxID=3128904 RepID=UPI0030EB9DDA
MAAWSQSVKIQGTIIDNENQPVSYANILLLKEQDSTLISGTSSDEKGEFTIKANRGTYLIKISYIGYKDTYKKLEADADVSVGIIVLDESVETLKDVTVTAKNPIVDRKIDRIVFNVANTSLTEGNIWEILKRTPGIIIINDQITLKGSGAIQVMINDRKVSLPYDDIVSLLQGTNAGSVQSVELITNPSAKYDAEGGAILNIKLNKNLSIGYNGNVSFNYNQGVFPKLSGGTSHFIKGEKLSFSISYNYDNRKSFRKNNWLINYLDNTSVTSIWESDTKRTTDLESHAASVFFDYQIDAKNILSLAVISAYRPTFERLNDSETAVFNPVRELDSIFTTLNTIERDNLNTSLYLDYAHNLNEKGEKLSFNGHYTYYDYDDAQNLDTDFFQPDGGKSGDNDFSVKTKQKINLYSAQVDYFLPITGNESLEAGGKYAAIDAENTINQSGFNVSQPGIDPTENDNFLYDEQIYAAYVSYEKQWKKWGIKIGLRNEYTETKGISQTNGQVNRNNYLEWFPTFYVNHTLNENHEISINYGRRITRPRYASINPFQYFITNNSIGQGDPNLLPSFKDLVTLSYTLAQAYTFEVYYRFEDNPERQLAFQDNDTNIIRYINTNIDREESYGLDFYTYKPITDRWTVNVLGSYFYSAERFNAIETSNELVDNGLWTLYASVDNYFTLLKDRSLTADVTFVYVSKVIFGNAQQEDYSQLGVSLRKKIFNNKGTVTVGVRDIFNDGNFTTRTQYLDQNSILRQRDENRLFTFGFRYRFGNQKLRDNKKTKDQEERERLN